MVRFQPPAGPGRRHASGEAHAHNINDYKQIMLYYSYLEWSELNSISLKIFATCVPPEEEE
jgi:hypothetical protein